MFSLCFRHSVFQRAGDVRYTPRFPLLLFICLFLPGLLKGLKRLLCWICIFTALIQQGTQTSCPSWGEGLSVQIVQSWFFILEIHTYFFLTEADDNVKIQVKSFSEWRHFPGSELLHPAFCPGYYFFFFHLPVLKEKMHCQGKLKSFPVLQLKGGKSTRGNASKVMTRHLSIYRYLFILNHD